MNINMQSIQLVAPVSSVDDAARIIAAGADELYCGAMFDDWVRLFGEADLVSRRQGRLSHITSRSELYRIARYAFDHHCKIALTLNARYSHLQQERVMDLINLWEDAGGTHLLVGEPALLFALQQRNSTLKRHLSIMAGTFNRSAIQFFKQLGVSRIVLPRELRLEEIKALVGEDNTIEFEMLAMLQKCQFIDGMCGFYHGVHLPADQAAIFDYSPRAATIPKVATVIDPQYEGHGCQLNYRTKSGRVTHLQIDDDQAPPCAACRLPDLYAAGVRFFKIAGRGYPVDMMVRVIRFISKSIETFRQSDCAEDGRAKIKEQYCRYFGSTCEKRNCYYLAATSPPGQRNKQQPQARGV